MVALAQLICLKIVREKNLCQMKKDGEMGMTCRWTIEDIIKGLEGMILSTKFIEHDFNGVVNIEACEQAIELLKAQESMLINPEEKEVLQGFSLDIPSSASILNSVNCHAISLEDASRIIAICACACDVMSPSGFIHWLKERIMNDYILKEYIEQ